MSHLLMNPAALYFTGAAMYILVAALDLRDGQMAKCGHHGVIALLYCLLGLSHLAHWDRVGNPIQIILCVQ